MLNHENKLPQGGDDVLPLNLKKTRPSKEASEIAQTLYLTLAEAMDSKELTPSEIMQSLAEFFVTTVRIIEEMDDIPDSFRKVLLRNVELNFDLQDAKARGIDLSMLLLMGVDDEADGDTED